jgi:hypothetical protein
MGVKLGPSYQEKTAESLYKKKLGLRRRLEKIT